ncbi:SIR2 family NAD-dependent protein deacylase [Mucilaginibacter sp. P25]|uniref:SIR2 family NAD-dependent protein deacylase n=1 Tax=Mucilaginibacter sp. P25 TaxID=3423945 RepID=UPI003D79DB6A
MSLQSLFNAIRREDTALWVGAGFSLYAGYPGGGKLQDILFKSLNTEEQSQLPANSSLKQTSAALVTFRGGSRNELNQILFDVFDKQPEATHLHDLLSKIPHFHEIITTNYDALIENSYTRRAHVIRSAKDVPYIKLNKPAIFKPHGDLQNLDSIIITENDYSGFYNLDKNDPFWTAIRDIIAKKNQLFLAYGFEDENIWSWFDLIDNAVGTHRKERFLVAPNWKPLQIKKLESRHIEYFDMTADQFLADLNEHLKKHIATDLENRIVSHDTFNTYISFHDLDSKVAIVSGKPKIMSLNKQGQAPTLNTINFGVNDKKTFTQIEKLANGFGRSVKIGAANISFLEHLVEGFTLPLSKESISEFHIIKLSKTHKCSIEIPEEDLVLEDVKFKITPLSQNKYSVEGGVYGFRIKANLNFKDEGIVIDINFSHPPLLPSLHKCLQFQRVVAAYILGKKTLLNWDGKVRDIRPLDVKMEAASNLDLLRFFEDLRIIEKCFQVRFEGASTGFTEQNFHLASELASLITNGYIQLDFPDGIEFTRTDGVKLIQMDHLPDSGSVLIVTGLDETVNILGIGVELGRPGIQINDIEKPEYNADRTEVHIKSKKINIGNGSVQFFRFNRKTGKMKSSIMVKLKQSNQ